MKVDVIAGVSPHPAGRIRLTGWVCGVLACEIIADSDDIVVGSSIQCDFVVPDPLIPPRAFRLRREKCHAGTEQDCRCYWVLEAFREARVYVNRQLTSRERLTYGDTISIGCHDLAFVKEADTPRNVRANRNVSDICRRLMKDYPLPPGFLRNTAAYRYAARRRLAASAVGLCLAILLLLVWQAPRVEYFEPAQSPVEIDLAVLLPPDAVRSLEDVARRNFDTRDPAMDKADLAEANPKIEAITPPPLIRDTAIAPAAPPTLSGPVLDSGTLNPMVLTADEPVDVQRDTVKLAAAAPADRQTRDEADSADEKPDLIKSSVKTMEVKAAFLASAKQDPQAPAQVMQAAVSSANWKLPALKPVNAGARGPVVSRQVDKLAAAAPARRLSVAEAAQRALEKSDLSGYRVKMDEGLAQPVAAKTVDQNLAASLGKQSPVELNVDRAAYMDQLARYKASPVQTESFMGMEVPVARIAEQLAQLEVNVQPEGKTLSVDGAVTPEEMDVCWKSGRFKTHAPGVPPPDADPATFCYVGKSEMDGKPCLYISFVCVDPDVSKILASSSVDGNPGSLVLDDSVEIFLDTNNDRTDYYQMIVNARGRYWTAYHPRPLFEDGGRSLAGGPSWACAPVIKSTINKSAGQWTCEIMIPFDKLGGVPADGSRWAVNFCRNFRGQRDDWQLQSWFAVYDKARNFHHPNKFGVFQW